MTFYVGLDLGQVNDYSALSFVEQTRPEPPQEAPPKVQRYQNPDAYANMYPGYQSSPRKPLPPAHYQVRHLERFPIGTSYPTIIAGVKARLDAADLRGMTLVVDATGVGRPVVDMLRAVGLSPVPITITAGQTPSEVDGYWHVPKRDLVSTMQVLLQSDRMKIAQQLPEAGALTRELLNFQAKITLAANETFGAWREGTHDDLVLSVALAAWCAEHKPGRYMDPHPGSYSFVSY